MRRDVQRCHRERRGEQRRPAVPLGHQRPGERRAAAEQTEERRDAPVDRRPRCRLEEPHEPGERRPGLGRRLEALGHLLARRRVEPGADEPGRNRSEEIGRLAGLVRHDQSAPRCAPTPASARRSRR
ncbi:MAG: hypothetical protein E6J79_07685 [Deltaproteobacteria bacterium]|nr:MAG: hypothetical protein E6J79_07685 [Deltaproteobacteria bacterium]